MKKIFYLILFVAVISCDHSKESDPINKAAWIELFNGKDLRDWDIKIAGYELNDNYNNTFRVEDGLLKVSYDQYEHFNGEFGHLFYKGIFSFYRLRIEYRFVGDQVSGGADWAYRNSGAMLHGQPAASMGLYQSFPVSIEGQFLGGDGVNPRSTANLCTPGTDVKMADTLATDHCINSRSKTFHGDQWVSVEFVVLSDSIIHHIVEGDTVITYSKPIIGGGHLPENYLIPEGTPLKSGTISLQAESHPIEFRKVDLMDLSKWYF